MRIDIDVKTVSEAGYDKYLFRNTFEIESGNAVVTSRYTDANSFVGGVIGSEGVMFLGSKQVRLDGKNKRIVINDGTTDRVIIGYLG
jgi:hypothetical protein